MKGFDAIKAGATELAGKFMGEKGKLFEEALALIQRMPGGVSGLATQFRANGLGDIASKLTGGGPAPAISSAQVVQGFGNDTINALAKSAGLDPKVVPEQLAGILPTIVKQLSSLATTAGAR